MPRPTAIPASSLAVTVAALALVTSSACAAAQTPPSAAPPAGSAPGSAGQRVENDVLRNQVTALDLELKAARARIAELERKLADATARLAAGSGAGGPPAVPPPTQVQATIDETVPNASPRALLRAFQDEYAAALGPVGGWSTPKERTIYLRALEKWIAATNRRHRAPVDWLVRLERVESVGEKTSTLRAVALDPGSGADLGDSFLITVPAALYRRLDAAQLLGADTLLNLRGALIPDAAIDEGREAIGAFDSPRFVGPFCEMGFTVDAQALSAVREVAWPPAFPSAPAAPQLPPPPAPPSLPPPAAPPVSPAGSGPPA